MTVEPHTPAYRGPGAHDLARWNQLQRDSLTRPRHRALLRSAAQIADRTLTELNAYRPPDTALPQGGVTWCRLALATYDQLHHDGAHNHLAPSTSPPCRADPDRIRAWLTATTAESTWQPPDAFDADSEQLPQHVVELVEQAQQAGVFGISGHHITVWHVADADGRPDGHLLTVDTPDGSRHASAHLYTALLIAGGHSGVDTAVHALADLAATVDQILTTGTDHPGPEHPAAPAPSPSPAAGRAFNQPQSPTGNPPPPFTAPPPKTPPGRHRRY